MFPKLIFFSFSLFLTEAIDLNVRDLIQKSLPAGNNEQFLQLYEENYDLLQSLDFKSFINILMDGSPTNESCHACDTVLKLGYAIPDNPNSIDFIKRLLCKGDLASSISQRECIGLIDRLGPPILYILHNTKVSLEEGCSVLVGHECSIFLNRSMTNMTFWELNLPKKKTFKQVNIDDHKHKNVLHLTDVHLDLFYTVGSNSKCNEPLCCRSTTYSNHIGNKNVSAGYWGEVNGDCDIPLELVKDSLQQIHQQHPDIDLIFWTGDSVPHDVWNTSKEMCLKHNQIMTDLIHETFKGIPVFPVLGNHEAHPINMYVPMEISEKSNHSMNWLYEEMSHMWSHWLSKANKATFLKGGYYSRMVNPGWKIIVLNSNVAYKANFWRVYDPMDPDGQLAWLVKELDHAERVGAQVSILGHIPPNDMYQAWVHNYIRIVDRYSNVITAAYNGHTHTDEIAVLYNRYSKAVGVNYISGSLTTFSYLNPSYKIFQLDAHGQPLDYNVYFLDLNHDNHLLSSNKIKHHRPVWIHEFSAKESYQMHNLSVSAWDKFVNQVEKDLDLSYLYVEHYHRHSIDFVETNHLSVEKIKRLVKSIKTVSPFVKHTMD